MSLYYAFGLTIQRDIDETQAIADTQALITTLIEHELVISTPEKTHAPA